MSAIEFRQTRTDAILAVVGSLLLHFFLFLLLVLWVSFAGFLIVKELQETVEKKDEKVVVISPEYFQREVIEPVVEKKRFTAVNPQAPEAVVEQADLIGERDTLAASETVLDEGRPDVPTQMTREEEKDQELPNVFNSDYVDAEVEQVAVEESVETQEVAPMLEEQSEDIAETSQEAPAEEESAPPEPLPLEEKLVETPDQIEVPAETMQDQAIEEIKEKVEEPQEEMVEKKESENQQPEVEEGLPKPKVDTQEAVAGFQTEQKKTRLIGSLSRSGKSSLEVQGTALGKYYSDISKIIERKWQANCLEYREYIQPGVISMQFTVDPDGKVSSPRPNDVVSTSQIQVGFTMKAIRASELPPMSEEVKKELEGERLELIYNFYF